MSADAKEVASIAPIALDPAQREAVEDALLLITDHLVFAALADLATPRPVVQAAIEASRGPASCACPIETFRAYARVLVDYLPLLPAGMTPAFADGVGWLAGCLPARQQRVEPLEMVA